MRQAPARLIAYSCLLHKLKSGASFRFLEVLQHVIVFVYYIFCKDLQTVKTYAKKSKSQQLGTLGTYASNTMWTYMCNEGGAQGVLDVLAKHLFIVDTKKQMFVN